MDSLWSKIYQISGRISPVAGGIHLPEWYTFSPTTQPGTSFIILASSSRYFFHSFTNLKKKKQKQLSLSQQKQESYYQIMCSWLYGSYLVRSRQVFSFTFKYMFFYSFIHKLFWTVQSNCRYLSSSSAWSIGRIARRAAYFSSFNALYGE